jgi:hypothetical protein
VPATGTDRDGCRSSQEQTIDALYGREPGGLTALIGIYFTASCGSAGK